MNRYQAPITLYYDQLSYVDGLVLPEEWDEMLSFCDYRFKVSDKGYVSIWPEGANKGELLHRIVTDCPFDLVVDHIDRNPFNNSMENLRTCTVSENMHNKGVLDSNKTGFEGVCFDRSKDKWDAFLNVNNTRYRKRFNSFDDAVCYRRSLELEHLGYLKCNYDTDRTHNIQRFFNVDENLNIRIEDYNFTGSVKFEGKIMFNRYFKDKIKEFTRNKMLEAKRLMNKG